jgi:hypothetical protein
MNNPAEAPHYPKIAFFQPVKGVLHPTSTTGNRNSRIAPDLVPLEHK